MDFSLTDEQLAVSEAAGGIFDGMADPERIAATEASEERIDRDLWRALAEADLLGLAVPEADGGAGYGLMEVCLLLEAQGTAVAPVPLWPTLLLGALPIARFGSDEQRARLLRGVVAGDTILTAALSGVAGSPTSSPSVQARPTPDGFVLDGTEVAVPAAHVATRIVVPARAADGVLLTLVDPRAPGVSLERAVTTNREVHPHLQLAGVAVPSTDVLVGPELGRSALGYLVVVATIGLCALQVGVCEAALSRTASYLNTRHQFGRPLSTFQGTMLKAADAAIDIEAMRVTWQNAAWRVDTGRDAADAARVAKWQASERGQRAVHTTQHLHGGMGADITYPIHRYFLWGKQIELLLGGPSAQLARLGADIAERALTDAEAGLAVGAIEGNGGIGGGTGIGAISGIHEEVTQ
jgi:3-oxocholest-4-en-26-oyl-CoA dehydrogenase beta subunit